MAAHIWEDGDPDERGCQRGAAAERARPRASPAAHSLRRLCRGGEDRQSALSERHADVPAPDAQFLADSQQQLAEKALGAPVSAAAWRTKPSYAILTTQDHVISPELQRWMYQRSGSKVTEVGASHAVFVSQPGAVARVIETAAKVDE
jgi:pimeloyl-ACP methyl ester carboxylesterase